MGNRHPTTLRIAELLLALIVIASLLVLAIRAGVRLESRWDTFMYHIPFAALWGGLGIPYEMNERIQLAYQGFPQLAHFVQGVLWRITGSINATGVVNLLAFLAFLAVCQRLLRAPFYIVGAIALTAPMVLIHTTVSYVDLFANSWLALGVVCLFRAYYFDERDNKAILLAGLAGLVFAAWSKMQLCPLVALFGLLYLLIYRGQRLPDSRLLQRAWHWIVIAGALAALPYVLNWWHYGSPFWPVPIPFLENVFNYSPLFDPALTTPQVPPPLVGSSQPELFFRSLFEVNHPHEYTNRARWIIDQGNAYIAFRSGGFWNVSVVIFLALCAFLLVFLDRARGLKVVLAGLLILLFLSVLPQSHELRYYMFPPLAWAGMIGMAYPHLRQRSALLALSLVVLAAGLFLYMAQVNRHHMKIERIGYPEIARMAGMARWWEQMEPGVDYCVVDMVPVGILMTGPTMSEFRVVDRSTSSLCPESTRIIGGETNAAKHATDMQRALDAIYNRRDYEQAVEILDKILADLPTHYGAAWQRAVALDRAGQTQAAIAAWEMVIAEAERNGYSDAEPARQRLEALTRDAKP